MPLLRRVKNQLNLRCAIVERLGVCYNLTLFSEVLMGDGRIAAKCVCMYVCVCVCVYVEVFVAEKNIEFT